MTVDLGTLSTHAGTIVIGGVTYPLTKQTLNDAGAMREWIKQRLPKPGKVLRELLDDLRPHSSPPAEPKPPKEPATMNADETAAWTLALSEYRFLFSRWQKQWEEYEDMRRTLSLKTLEDAQADRTAADQERGNALISSIPGIAYQLWLAIRRADPSVSLQKLETDLGKENVADIWEKMQVLLALPQELVDAMLKKKPSLPENKPTE